MEHTQPGSPVAGKEASPGWWDTFAAITSLMYRGVHRDWIIADTELGHGRYGKVREARNRRTGQKAAVKIMDKRDKGAKEVKLMMREIEITKALHHPNCIEHYGTFESKNKYYIVMEALEGGSLSERVAENRIFPENLAAHVFVQLVGAIDYLHSVGIVHRDIKPENMMFKTRDPYSRIKLLDFGLGRFVDVEGLSTGRKRLWSRTGSPNFVAPEVIAKSGYGMECDVWSAGVILFLLLFGAHPFDQQTIEGKFTHIKRADFAFPPEQHNILVSAEVKDLIRHVLVLDLNERYSCRQCLKHVWVQRYLATTILRTKSFQDSIRRLDISGTPTPSEDAGERSESDTQKGLEDAEHSDTSKEVEELNKVRSVLAAASPEKLPLTVYMDLMSRGIDKGIDKAHDKAADVPA